MRTTGPFLKVVAMSTLEFDRIRVVSANDRSLFINYLTQLPSLMGQVCDWSCDQIWFRPYGCYRKRGGDLLFRSASENGDLKRLLLSELDVADDGTHQLRIQQEYIPKLLGFEPSGIYCLGRACDLSAQLDAVKGTQYEYTYVGLACLFYHPGTLLDCKE